MDQVHFFDGKGKEPIPKRGIQLFAWLRKLRIVFPLLLILTSIGIPGFVLLSSHTTAQPMPTELGVNRAVLGSATGQQTTLDGIQFNIPATFNDTATFNGNVVIKGKSLNVGGGTIQAANILYGVTAGSGIAVTNSQTPTITNTGVLSLQGQTGAVTLTAGSGIALSGTTITNSQPGGNAFGTITANGTSFSAGNTSDTLTFVNGNGITLSEDTTNKKLTINDTIASGLTQYGVIYANGSNSLASLTPGNAGYVLSSNGTNAAPSWVAVAGANPSFSTISSGTNTTAAMIVGSGASLTFSGSGTINAATLNGNTFANPGAIGSGTSGTGAFTTLSGTTVTGTTFNGLTITSNGSNMLSIANGKTLTVNNSITFGGTDSTSFTLPSSSDTLVGLAAIQTLTNKTLTAPTINGTIATTGLTLPAHTVSGNITGSGSPTISNFGAINGLTLTSNADGFAVSGGTTSRSLTVTGSNITLTGGGNTLTLTGNSSLNQNLLTSSAPTFTDVTLSTLTANGGLLYANTSGTVGQTTAGNSGQCLQSVGGGTPTWGTCGYWQQNNGTVAPLNITNDLLVGGVATTSALFQVSGTTGSVTTAGNETFTGANATIGTAVKGQWTLNSNTYSFRRQITITNNSASTLPALTQVTLSPSGSSLTDICNNTQSNNNDLRVSYNIGTEIAVNVTRNCTSSLSINFETQASIAGTGSTNTYYLYYGNATLGSGPSSYNYSNVQVDSMDNIAGTGWTSSDNTNFAISQNTTTKQEGTGSMQAIQTSQASGIGTWSTTGQTQLTHTSYGIGLATYTLNGTTYLYQIGDFGTGSSTVYRAQLDGSGNVGSWSTTGQGQFPVQQQFAAITTASVGGTTYIYDLGGVSGSSTSTVYRAQLDGSGNVGSWSTTGQGQLPATSQFGYATTLTYGGTTYMYLLQDNVNGAFATGVYRAQLDGSGNVGSWSTTGQGQLPSTNLGYDYQTFNLTNNGTSYFYVLGGVSGTTGQKGVYRATVDTSGNIGSWSTTGQGQMSTGVAAGTVVYFNNTNIYLIGGYNNGMQSTVYQISLDNNQNISGFSTTGQGQLPTALDSIASTVQTIGGTTYVYALGGKLTSGNAASTVYKATLSTPTFSATRSSSLNWSNRGGLSFDVYSSRTGQYMSFEFANNNGGYNTYPFTVNNASTWQTVTIDLSSVANAAKNNVTSLGFLTTDPTTGFTTYYDDLESLVSPFTGSAPTVSNGSSAYGASNLAINAQGTGGLNLNYDPTNGQAGSGGMTLYNGSTTPIFSIDGSGNASQSGSHTFTGTNGSNLNVLNGNALTIQTSAGGNSGLTPVFTVTNAGNIGIGTTTPTALLDVAGSASVSGSLTFRTGVGSIQTTANNTLTVGGTTTGNIILSPANNNGFVGVDTALPLYAFDVQTSQTATAAAEIYNTNNGANADGLAVKLGFTGNGTVPTSQTAGNSFIRFLNGNGVAQGSIDSNGLGGITYSTGGIDFAEYFTTIPGTTFTPGDVVSLGGSDGQIATKAAGAYDPKLLGIVSAHPGYVGGTPGENKVLVGLTGQLPVKISTENGIIHAGDLLTSSSDLPGVAIKATQPGEIIARALEGYSGENIGSIMVYVSASYADPTLQIGSTGDLRVGGQTLGTNNVQLSALQQPQPDTNQLIQLTTALGGVQNQLASFSAQLGTLTNLTKTVNELEQTVTLNQGFTGTSSAILGAMTGNGTTVTGSLNVFGRTVLQDLGVTGVIDTGLLSVNGLDTTSGSASATINTLGSALKLESLAAENVDIENGKVMIDTNGNIVVKGELTTAKLHIDTTNTSAATLGKATIPAGQTEVTVKTSAVTQNSQIFTSPYSILPSPLGVTSVVPGTSFTVGIAQPQTKDILFGWWIVDQK